MKPRTLHRKGRRGPAYHIRFLPGRQDLGLASFNPPAVSNDRTPIDSTRGVHFTSIRMSEDDRTNKSLTHSRTKKPGIMVHPTSYELFRHTLMAIIKGARTGLSTILGKLASRAVKSRKSRSSVRPWSPEGRLLFVLGQLAVGLAVGLASWAVSGVWPAVLEERGAVAGDQTPGVTFE